MISAAWVMERVRDAALSVDADGRLAGIRGLTPEGLHGRRKTTALLRWSLTEASPGAVDGDMEALGMNRISRSKGARTTIPGRDGRRAGDLLDRAFIAAVPNGTWVMDFTCRRTWVGFVYVTFIVDVFTRRVVAWQAATSKDVELVMTAVRMAIWQRQLEGHPIERNEPIGHGEAGSQQTSITFTENRDLECIRRSIGSVANACDCENVGCLLAA